MKKILFVSVLLCASFVFTNCKKKYNSDPAPSSPAAPTTASGTLTVTGSASENLSIYSGTASGVYVISGASSAGAYTNLDAGFLNGKPTASKTVTISSTEFNPYLSISDANTDYSATSGTATVTVIGSTVSVSFTNVTFKDDNSSATITGSGKLTALY